MTFKLEQLQLSGSFKTRGAFNSLLSQKVPASGVVAASGGNHGAAVALAATALGHKSAIYVPSFAPATKIDRIKAFGGEAVVIGDNFSITQGAASERATSTGALMVHAYDQPQTLAGQGTLAKEFMEQAPGLDAILVAVGGGGLIGGMALWCHAVGGPKIIGVEPEGAANFHAARQAGHPVDIKPNSIAADSLGPPTVGKLMFEQANDKIAAAVLVEDKAIKEAQRLLWRDFRIVVEPGGATALAALLSGRYKPKAGARIGVLLCGGNCDPATVV